MRFRSRIRPRRQPGVLREGPAEFYRPSCLLRTRAGRHLERDDPVGVRLQPVTEQRPHLEQ